MWRLHDVLDPYRIGYRSLRTNFWEKHYNGVVKGDVDWQPQTENVLIAVGAQETNADGVNSPPGPGMQRWARVMELTHDQPARKVWEMRLQDDDTGWSIYRAERLPSLYP